MVANAKKQHTFSIVVRGLDLSNEQQAQLRAAVESAAAQVIATFDFHGNKVAMALPLRPGIGGGTQGREYLGITSELAERFANEAAGP